MIPFVMDETKPFADLLADHTNGMGRLAECQSLKIHETLGNEYTAQMEVPISAYNSGLLHHGGIIKAYDNGSWQLFRINRFAKSLRDGMITCYMNHISYDLKKKVCRFSGEGYPSPTMAIQAINQRVVGGAFEFVINSELAEASGMLTFLTPITVRNALIGENSILSIWSGEAIWDNATVTLVDQRGTDKTAEVIIEYGKNILDAKQEKEISNIYDGAVGFAFTPDFGTAIVDTYQGEENGENVQILDWSDKASKTEGYASNPLYYVHHWTEEYIQQNDTSTPKVSMDISFLSLEKQKEYELIQNLETLNLGDIVTVRIKELGIDLTARVIEREYDSLNEQHTKMQIGDYVQTLADTIVGMNTSTSNEVSYVKTTYAKTATQNTNGMMSAADKATLNGLTPTMIADDTVVNQSSDLATERYSQWTINGSGYIILSANVYSQNQTSYGNIELSVQHSINNGSTWVYDAFSAHRHENGGTSYDGIQIGIPLQVSGGELIRVTWKLTKEDAKTAKIKILGFGCTGTRTVNGGSL